ncbi:hypothetical protein ACMA1I_03535 [Pontibacter sp. 13R65]
MILFSIVKVATTKVKVNKKSLGAVFSAPAAAKGLIKKFSFGFT